MMKRERIYTACPRYRARQNTHISVGINTKPVAIGVCVSLLKRIAWKHARARVVIANDPVLHEMNLAE